MEGEDKKVEDEVTTEHGLVAAHPLASPSADTDSEIPQQRRALEERHPHCLHTHDQFLRLCLHHKGASVFPQTTSAYIFLITIVFR